MTPKNTRLNPSDGNNNNNTKDSRMTKKFSIITIIYASLGLIFGVFYREFTKFNSFEGRTALSFVHVHYLVLGVVFFLILLLLDYRLNFKESRFFKVSEILYHVGLNIAVLALLVRGILQVMNTTPDGTSTTTISSGLNGAISGVAGIGHALLGTSLILILVSILLIINKQNRNKKVVVETTSLEPEVISDSSDERTTTSVKTDNTTEK